MGNLVGLTAWLQVSSDNAAVGGFSCNAAQYLCVLQELFGSACMFDA